MARSITFGLSTPGVRTTVGLSGTVQPRASAVGRGRRSPTLGDLLQKPLFAPRSRIPGFRGGSYGASMLQALLRQEAWPEGFSPRQGAASRRPSGGLVRPYGLGRRGGAQLARLAGRAAAKRMPWLDLLEWLVLQYEYQAQPDRYIGGIKYGECTIFGYLNSHSPAVGTYGIHTNNVSAYNGGPGDEFISNMFDQGTDPQGHPAYRYLGRAGVDVFPTIAEVPPRPAYSSPQADPGVVILPAPDAAPLPQWSAPKFDERGAPLTEPQASQDPHTVSVPSPNGPPITVYPGLPPRQPEGRRVVKDGTKAGVLKWLVDAYDAQELAALIDSLIEAANSGDWAKVAQLIAFHIGEDVVVGQILKYEPKAGWSAWDPRWTSVLR